MANVKRVLEKLGIQEPQLLGKGREGVVYAYEEDKAVKIFQTPPDINFLKELAGFYALLAHHDLPYATPQILAIQEDNRVTYTIEKRLQGQPLDRVFPTLDDEQKQKALRNYFDAIKPMNAITFPQLPYGQVIRSGQTATDVTWAGFLQKRFEQRLLAQPRLQTDVVDYQQKVSTYKKVLQSLPNPEKSLVHGDYYFTNVLVNYTLEITAVLDFGEHALVGDKRMDVAGAIAFLNVSPDVTPEHISLLTAVAREKYGEAIEKYIDLYRLFYGFYFADTADEELYQWCLADLNNEHTWNRIQTS